MSRYLSSLGWRQNAKFSTPHRYTVEGRFETDGAAAGVNQVGLGVKSITYSATGIYTFVFNQAFKHILNVECRIADSASSNDDVKPVLSSFTPGDANTPASIQLVTQSADGTAAALNGPVVLYKFTFSNENDLASKATMA